VEWWVAELVNGSGQVVKEFKGKDRIPEQITWDGIEEGWIRVFPGEPYNFVFVCKKSDGRLIKEGGEAFRLTGFQQEKDDRVVVHLGTQDFFSAQTELTDKGRQWIASLCGIVSRHTSRPVLIDVFTKDRDQGEKKSDRVVAMISEVLMRDPAWTVTNLQVDPNEPETMKIQIYKDKQ